MTVPVWNRMSWFEITGISLSIDRRAIKDENKRSEEHSGWSLTMVHSGFQNSSRLS